MEGNLAQTDSNTQRAMADQTSASQEEAPQPFKYQLALGVDEAELEYLNDYIPGGFHPVAIGDLLGESGQFRVVHKLGCGGFATVWLCHDKVSGKWRAVKIMASRASQDDCAEFKALRLFAGVDKEVLEANHIQLALEHFWIHGPNGRHLCFVLPFLGPELTYVFGRYGHVPEMMKEICFQLVKALRFIHSRGLCHGDFRTTNILFRLADGVDEWEEEEIIKLLGEPELVQVEPVYEGETEREPGVPAYLVEPGCIAHGSGACSIDIAVIDFGVSYAASDPPVGKGTGIPLNWASPEERLELDDLLGPNCDIWALGNCMAQVLINFTPFGNQYTSFLDGLKKIETVAGPMPDPYRTAWKEMDGVFVNCQDKEGEFRDDEGWKDESVFATVWSPEYARIQRERKENGEPENYLQWCIVRPHHMGISSEESVDIAAQAAANPRQLPTFDWNGPPLKHDEIIQHTIEKVESGQMFDLLMKIFQWHPKDRASLDQILEHEWFGDRSRQQSQPAESAHPTQPLFPSSSSSLTPESSIENDKKRRRSSSLDGPERSPKRVSIDTIATSGVDETNAIPAACVKESNNRTVVGLGVTIASSSLTYLRQVGRMLWKGAGQIWSCLSWFVGRI